MNYRSLFFTLLSPLLFSFSRAAPTTAVTNTPPACVVFDVDWNLLAFGFKGQDYNAGTQDTWGSGTPKNITKTGRPPFNFPNTKCYLSQFSNAIYILNANKSTPSSIYIYDVTSASWSTQKTSFPSQSLDPSSPSTFDAILDHDTNVFYAYSNAELYSLDMGSLKAAQEEPIPWTDVQKPDLSVYQSNQATQTPGKNTDGYQPVMGLAQNHIHFLGVPGLDPGSLKIFVIHYSFMQPTPQTYSPASFPTTSGKAVSIFKPTGQGVQTEFAFIPISFASTYIINVLSNTTKTFSPPPKNDAGASFAASTSAILMLGSDGVVSWLAYDPSSTTASGGTWQTVSKLPSVNFAASLANSGLGTASSNGTNSTSYSNSSSSSNSTSSSSSSHIIGGGGPLISLVWSTLVGCGLAVWANF